MKMDISYSRQFVTCVGLQLICYVNVLSPTLIGRVVNGCFAKYGSPVTAILRSGIFDQMLPGTASRRYG